MDADNDNEPLDADLLTSILTVSWTVARVAFQDPVVGNVHAVGSVPYCETKSSQQQQHHRRRL